MTGRKTLVRCGGSNCFGEVVYCGQFFGLQPAMFNQAWIFSLQETRGNRALNNVTANDHE
jgi:hypothetical protein